MASRPVFVPQLDGPSFVREVAVEFEWFPGFALVQKQRSIQTLHAAAEDLHDLSPLLEISSKSPIPFGRELSAFNLMLEDSAWDRPMSVEVAFQGSKVFENGGPYNDLYDGSAREAKRDARLKESGRLRYFQFGEKRWPLGPNTAFYDWLYLRALQQQGDLAEQLLAFAGFTDIEFNPKRSLNCQARAAALYVSLAQRGILDEVINSPVDFLRSFF